MSWPCPIVVHCLVSWRSSSTIQGLKLASIPGFVASLSIRINAIAVIFCDLSRNPFLCRRLSRGYLLRLCNAATAYKKRKRPRPAYGASDTSAQFLWVCTQRESLRGFKSNCRRLTRPRERLKTKAQIILATKRPMAPPASESLFEFFEMASLLTTRRLRDPAITLLHRASCLTHLLLASCHDRMLRRRVAGGRPESARNRRF